MQDNNWGISVIAREARTTNAAEYVKGFKSIKSISIDGSDFIESHHAMKNVMDDVRTLRHPYLLHATAALIGHHTSGVRKDSYKSADEQKMYINNDPIPKLRSKLLETGIDEILLQEIKTQVFNATAKQFANAVAAPEPDITTVEDFIFVPTLITQEKGERSPAGKKKS